MNKNDIKLLVDTENPVILEIGANNGNDTRQFLDTFKRGKFYAFEPDPRAFAKLDKMQEERLFKYQMAIGNKNGTAEFHQSSGRPPGYDKSIDWDLSGSMRKPKNHIPIHPWCKFKTTITVQVMKLDTWIESQDIDIIDFAWVDTQGCEEDVISGGRNTIRDKVRFFYTEYSNSELYEGEITREQILKMLPEYDLYKDFGTDLLLANRNFL